jgi:AcrR family transcriptional regulator
MTVAQDVDTADLPCGPAGTKQGAIADAAIAVFLRFGYGRTSMDAVAREAGVSKQTIYHHFGSKEALFGAIVRDLADRMLAPLAPGELASGDVATVLTAVGHRILELALSPTGLALHRLIVAEATQFPELGRTTYESGPQVAVETLADYLAAAARRGTITVADPRLAAEQFIGMLLGHLHLRALFKVEETPSADEIERSIRQAVADFTAAHRPA